MRRVRTATLPLGGQPLSPNVGPLWYAPPGQRACSEPSARTGGAPFCFAPHARVGPPSPCGARAAASEAVVAPPNMQVPRVELPRVELPRVEPPRVEPPRIEPPRIEPPGIAPPRIQPPRVEPRRIEPRRPAPAPVAPRAEASPAAPQGREGFATPTKVQPSQPSRSGAPASAGERATQLVAMEIANKTAIARHERRIASELRDALRARASVGRSVR